jgi:predicted membrane protein
VEAVSPVETAIFFWSFVVVILFVLLNMVLAVIFTVYDEKNQEIRVKETKKEKHPAPAGATATATRTKR